MLHCGDVTKIDGKAVPPVDVICGGSPCQDLSVAGKRAGLAGEQSGLYMEQIRIVKEMRQQDVLRGRTGEFIRPRYMVWENVPGAFSSNGGKDFAAVIEEIIKICEPDADLQVCVPDNKWTKSGCYYASDGRWSLAWRVHDAQFWGVPQRRKRIALIADFGGLTAPEILFERKGMHRNPESCAEERKRTAAGAEGCIGEPILIHDQATRFSGKHGEKSDGKGNGLGIGDPGDCMNTITSGDRHAVFAVVGDRGDQGAVAYAIDKAITTGGNRTAGGSCVHKGITPTLTVDRPHAVFAVDCRNCTEGKVNGTLQSHPNGGSLNLNNVVRVNNSAE